MRRFVYGRAAGRAPAGVPAPLRGCFLTQRIDYFRATAPLLANERKIETADFQSHPCEAPPLGGPKAPILPLYGANRGSFSAEKGPWNENSMGWIGRGMGWKWKSMGWMARAAARTHEKSAKRRRNPRVRINALPYSAQGPGARALRPAGARKKAPAGGGGRLWDRGWRGRQRMPRRSSASA